MEKSIGKGKALGCPSPLSALAYRHMAEWLASQFLAAHEGAINVFIIILVFIDLSTTLGYEFLQDVRVRFC